MPLPSMVDSNGLVHNYSPPPAPLEIPHAIPPAIANKLSSEETIDIVIAKNCAF